MDFFTVAMAAKRKSHPIKIASDDFLYSATQPEVDRRFSGDLSGQIGDDLADFEARLTYKRQELLESRRADQMDLVKEEKR